MELFDSAFPTLGSVDIFDDAKAPSRAPTSPSSSAPCPARPVWSAPTCSPPTAASSAPRARPLNAGAAEDIQGARRGQPRQHQRPHRASHAPDIPSSRFTAMTRLDHNRALAQLATKAGCHVTDIDKVTVWGNHSSTQYPT